MRSYHWSKLDNVVCIALIITSALSALYSVHVLYQFSKLYYIQDKTESYIKEVAVGLKTVRLDDTFDGDLSELLEGDNISVVLDDFNYEIQIADDIDSIKQIGNNRFKSGSVVVGSKEYEVVFVPTLRTTDYVDTDGEVVYVSFVPSLRDAVALTGTYASSSRFWTHVMGNVCAVLGLLLCSKRHKFSAKYAEYDLDALLDVYICFLGLIVCLELLMGIGTLGSLVFGMYHFIVG